MRCGQLVFKKGDICLTSKGVSKNPSVPLLRPTASSTLSGYSPEFQNICDSIKKSKDKLETLDRYENQYLGNLRKTGHSKTHRVLQIQEKHRANVDSVYESAEQRYQDRL